MWISKRARLIFVAILVVALASIFVWLWVPDSIPPDGLSWMLESNEVWDFPRTETILEGPGEAKIPRPAGAGEGCAVALVNTGESAIRNINVFSDFDYSDLKTIVQQACADTHSEGERAEALWVLMKENVRHWYPATAKNECHDPVKLFNVYGYGFCDDSAKALTVLWLAAGLKARTWGLSGHVVPEVFYDGDWRLLDPDQQMRYRKEDGSVAGVEYLADHPEIVENTKSTQGYNQKTVAEIFSTKENNFLVKSLTYGHTMFFDLLPGEALARFKLSSRGCIIEAYPDEGEPSQYGNSLFGYSARADFARNKRPPESAINFEVKGRRDPGLRLRYATARGVLYYEKEFPFAIVSASTTVELESTDDSARVVLELVEEGSKPSDYRVETIGEISGRFDGKKTFDLPARWVRMKYGFSLCLKAYCDDSKNLTIKDFQVVTVCQSSVQTFPDPSDSGDSLSLQFDVGDSENGGQEATLHFFWREKE